MTIRGFFGGLLIAIGWLVAILAGGCSLIFSFIGGPAALGIVLLFGGIPFLSGLVLIGIGGVIRGKKKRDNYQYKNPYAIPEEM
ncbi:MAG: hypothetical protein OEY94_10425, partial [Alphaproteobacteria bacterium]|nr:hypothetical protein [Alphaproteobacteria bacterium]